MNKFRIKAVREPRDMDYITQLFNKDASLSILYTIENKNRVIYVFTSMAEGVSTLLLGYVDSGGTPHKLSTLDYTGLISNCGVIVITDISFKVKNILKFTGDRDISFMKEVLAHLLRSLFDYEYRDTDLTGIDSNHYAPYFRTLSHLYARGKIILLSEYGNRKSNSLYNYFRDYVKMEPVCRDLVSEEGFNRGDLLIYEINLTHVDSIHKIPKRKPLGDIEFEQRA